VLSKRCVDSLLQRGFHKDQIHTEPFLHMRYDGTDCALLCEPGSNTNFGIRQGDFHQSFTEKYSITFRCFILFIIRYHIQIIMRMIMIMIMLSMDDIDEIRINGYSKRDVTILQVQNRIWFLHQ